MEEEKICNTCKKKLPLYYYEPHNKPRVNKETGERYMKTYIRNDCKSCRKGVTVIPRQIREARRLPKAQRLWEYHLRQAYGITPEDYNNILKSQDGKCKICRSNIKLHLDHCHTTGKVRGILCSMCNHGIGNFKDNIELMKKAIEYLS